jgi:hypothetical protein
VGYGHGLAARQRLSLNSEGHETDGDTTGTHQCQPFRPCFLSSQSDDPQIYSFPDTSNHYDTRIQAGPSRSTRCDNGVMIDTTRDDKV